MVHKKAKKFMIKNVGAFLEGSITLYLSVELDFFEKDLPSDQIEFFF